MATLTYSATTSGTTLPKLWKKLQGPLLRGFNAKCEEWGWIRDLEQFKVNHSAREVTAPIDIERQGGGASIVEGSYEANPFTVAPQEVTLTWINENYRFTRSLLAKYLDKYAGEAQIEDQMKYQGMKLIEALCNRVGRQFYSTSDALRCKTSTNASSATQTLTLIDGHGESDIDNAAYLTGLFEVDDRIALHTAGTLIDTTNSFGRITAKDASLGTLSVTMVASCDVDANDSIVFSNGLGNTLIADTDYNKWPVGLLDAANSTSVHSLSGSTYPLWTAYTNTTGGRFGLAYLRAGQYAIQNNGGGKADTMILSNGVLTDMTLQQQAAQIFDDPLNMEFDGATKVKGVQIRTSRKVPPNRLWLMDSRKTMFRWTLMPMPNADGEFPEGEEYTNVDKLQDLSAEVFSLDFSYAFVWKNRSCLAHYEGLTEA
jgi:hypothetical protein